MNVAHQDLLIQHLRVLFPHETPHINARKQTQLKYSQSNSLPLELDVWFPKLQLCFEFQDDYHYVTTWYHQRSLSQVQWRDTVKRDIVTQVGMRLICVPYWWDGQLESLKAAIKFQCPDLMVDPPVPSPVTPPLPSPAMIPLNPLPASLSSTPAIPEVGELMYASFPPDIFKLGNHDTWWLGEKYDGIRCCWNPQQNQLYSRFGYEFALPPPISSCMPPSFLDAEIWFGRELYALTSALFSIAVLVIWNLLRIIAFDSPVIRFQDKYKPFEQRYGHLYHAMPTAHPFVIVAPRLACPDDETASLLIHAIITNGGEGVILRKMGSYYSHGRSSDLLKIKTSHEDKEGIVLKVAQNGVDLQLPDGVTFTVPAENVMVGNLAVGDVVSFSYESRARAEIPVNPRIYRKRIDVSWEDIANRYYGARKLRDASTPAAAVNFTSMALGYWTLDTMRAFMENFARARNQDPLLPETWYSISSQDVSKDKDGRVILKKLNGYINAIHNLFPDIHFDPDSFATLDQTQIEVQRSFFERYAQQHHNQFDPLLPTNWYHQSPKHIMAMQDARKVIPDNNVSKALFDAFPEIGLDKSRLFVSPWSKISNQRKFFETYATENHFDPLNPSDWYQQSSQLQTNKYCKRIVRHYNGSFSAALMTSFPDIGLNKLYLQQAWKLNEPAKRREFFEIFAQQNGFDPLIPENWYKQKKQAILSSPGGKLIARYHGTISNALEELFPEIGLITNKLRARSGKNLSFFSLSHALPPATSILRRYGEVIVLEPAR